MATPRVVVWESPEDIRRLRALVFDDASVPARRRALAAIKAYATRGPLPQSVESTAQLVSAMLQDVPGADSTGVRMGYAMAVIRFVNGLLDPAQKAQFAVPLHLLARNLGLPASFVELRHMATHEELPSLELLRHMTGRCLGWLHDNYWAANDGGDANTGPATGGPEFQESVKSALRKWRALRRSDPTKIVKPGDATPGGKEFWAIVNEITQLAASNERAVFEVLLHRNVLVPQQAKGAADSDFTKPARKLYGPLLETLGPDFVQGLALYLVEFLNSRPTDFDWVPTVLSQSSGSDPSTLEATKTKQAVYIGAQHWLKHFLIPKSRGSKWLSDVDDIVAALLSVPRQSNAEVLKSYVAALGEKAPQGVSELVDDMQRQIDAETNIASALTPGNKRKVDEIESEVAQFDKRLRTESQGTAASPGVQRDPSSVWNLVPDWKPRPIGVL